MADRTDGQATPPVATALDGSAPAPLDGWRTPTMEVAMSDEHHLEVLRQVLDAFNRHDLDAIMSFFAADCVLETPRGVEPWGARFVGTDEVRRGLAARFEGMPDVSYTDATHTACGSRGVSEWTIGGTTVSGDRVEVRGCDLWTFDTAGRIVRKDSYWKRRDA